MNDRPGLHDPDDWYNRWKRRHASPLFDGMFATLVLARLASDPDGVGRQSLAYVEGDGSSIEVEVSYVLETFPAGRVFHVLSIVSPDDPPPTLGSA